MGFLRMLGDAMGFHKSHMELKPGGVVYMKLTLIIAWDVMRMTMGCPGMPVV